MNLYVVGYYLLIFAFIYSMYAQGKVGTVYRKYFGVPSQKGITGREVARMMLDRYGLYHVSINSIPGTLTDHYDPRTKVMNLSQEVYSGTSLAALGVAAHETGHAIQDGEDYGLLRLRGAIAPVAMISSRLVWLMIMIGFFISSARLIQLAAILFIGVFLFQLVTLPVEYDASRRAMDNLEGMGIITRDEYDPIQRVLKAAITTYIAATLASFAQLLRLFGLSRSND